MELLYFYYPGAQNLHILRSSLFKYLIIITFLPIIILLTLVSIIAASFVAVYVIILPWCYFIHFISFGRIPVPKCIKELRIFEGEHGRMR
jgi:uncharacterized membrane protein